MSTAIQAPLLAEELPASARLALRPYQKEALTAFLDGWDRGLQRMLMVLATGAGKTVIFSHLVGLLNMRTLVLAHRDELIDQAADKLRIVLGPSVAVGIVKAERNEIHCPVLVGSIQTVTGPKRLAQLPKDIGLVIVDEAHHSAADTYVRVLKGLGCFREGGPLLLGVTATPDRADGSSIGATIFQEQVYEKSMLDLIEEGYLCDIQARRIELAANLAGVHTGAGDFKPGELATELLKAGAIQHVVTAYQEYALGRKALVFTPTVQMAHDIAALFRDQGIAAEAVDGTTHPEMRRATLRRLAAGVTQIVCNCAVLTEGFDEPSISCLIIARPTQSRPLFVQMLGRGLRLAAGKTDCLVLDLVGNAGKHDVASIPNVFGVPGDMPEDVESVKKAIKQAREQKERRAREEREMGEKAALVAQEVQLLRSATAIHWVSVRGNGIDYMAVNLGKNTLLKLGETPAGWAVIVNRAGQRAMRLITGQSKEIATREAERYARIHGVPWAWKAKATWRSEPATQKTKIYANAIGCTLPPNCTAGDASDRILVHQCINGIQTPATSQRR